MPKTDNLVAAAQRFTQVLPSLADVDELFWFVAREMVAPLGYQDCVVFEVDRSTGVLRQVAAYGVKAPTPGTIENRLEIPSGRGITGYVAMTAQPIIVDDVTTDPRYVADLPGQRSEVTVPILIGQDVYAVIDCESPDVGAFDEVDVKALTVIAGLVAPKLEGLHTRVVFSHKKRRLAEHNLYLSSQLEVARNRARSAAHVQTTGTLMQLSGGIAHDFNNQLAVMRGALDVAAQREGRLSSDLQLISVAVERSAELTRRLLAFSGQHTLFPHCINLAQVMAEMHDLLNVSLESWITIETDIAEDLWNVNVDLGQLENAILNLVLNARDAMPRGGRIQITCRNLELNPHHNAATDPHPDPEPLPQSARRLEGEYVALSVTDEGVGMSEEVQARAFDSYFTTKSRGQGTGLGLAMVSGFVRQSGGETVLTSAEGHGTTVTLYFPRDTSVAKTTAPTPRPTPVPYGNGEIILVVEDNAEFARTVGEMLGLLRYQPIIANTAADAVTIISQSRAIAAVLTDVTLDSGVLGSTLIEQVSPTLGATPVIFMSGFAESGHQHLMPTLNTAKFLQKPFAFDELADTLRNALRPGDVV